MINQNRNDELISLDELCELLKVKRSYVYNLTSTNSIPFYRIGGLKFRLTEVLKWIELKKEKIKTPKTFEDLL